MNNIAIIVDEEDDSFGLEYDNKLGKRNFMRLDGRPRSPGFSGRQLRQFRR
jgi:hypothetical protein